MFPVFCPTIRVKNRLPYIGGFVFFITTLFCFSSLKAQGNFSFENHKTQYFLPFKFTRNLIIIPLMINNQGPYNFIFDTGASIMIFTNPDLPQKLGLHSTKAILVKGFGSSNDVEAQIITGLSLKIGPISGKGFSAAVLPEGILEFSNYVGMPIDGMIGYDLVKDLRLKINFNTSQIKFENPEKSFDRKLYKSFPLEINNNQALIKATASLKGAILNMKLVLDTGGGNTVFIDPRSLNNLKIPQNSPKSTLGWGLTGMIDGKISRLDYLNLNGIIIQKVICAFPVYPDSVKNQKGLNGNGNLGNEILRRFNVVIDYPNRRFYLKSQAILQSPFDYDMSGLNITAYGDSYQRFLVSSIDPGSPADKAGIKEGDLILTIDDLPSNQYNLGELDFLFKSRDNRKVSLSLFREGQFIETVMILKRRV